MDNSQILASKYQEIGRAHYLNSNYHAAFMSYTNSLFHLKSFSAYVVRCIIYFRLDHFKKCLEDIQCALKLHYSYNSEQEVPTSVLELKNNLIKFIQPDFVVSIMHNIN